MEIVQHYKELERYRGQLMEHDITTKFVLPLFEALNWNIYRFSKRGLEVSEQGFSGDLGTKEIKEGQPDIRLASKSGKIVFVEVKRELSGTPTRYLKGYDRYMTGKGRSKFIVLTDFKRMFIFTKGKKGLVQREVFSLDDYLTCFDKLWRYLSNSPKAIKKRAAIIATGNR